MNDKRDVNQVINSLLDLLMHLGIKDAGKDPTDPDGDKFFIDVREINVFVRRFYDREGSDGA